VGFVDGRFQTDGAKSSIEVLNLLLGQGNDKLTITGTLDPIAGVTVTSTMTIVGSAAGGTLTRPGTDWLALGFLVGQSVQLTLGGVVQPGTWKLPPIGGTANSGRTPGTGAAPTRGSHRTKGDGP